MTPTVFAAPSNKSGSMASTEKSVWSRLSSSTRPSSVSTRSTSSSRSGLSQYVTGDICKGVELYGMCQWNLGKACPHKTRPQRFAVDGKAVAVRQDDGVSGAQNGGELDAGPKKKTKKYILRAKIRSCARREMVMPEQRVGGESTYKLILATQGRTPSEAIANGEEHARQEAELNAPSVKGPSVLASMLGLSKAPTPQGWSNQDIRSFVAATASAGPPSVAPSQLVRSLSRSGSKGGRSPIRPSRSVPNSLGGSPKFLTARNSPLGSSRSAPAALGGSPKALTAPPPTVPPTSSPVRPVSPAVKSKPASPVIGSAGRAPSKPPSASGRAASKPPSASGQAVSKPPSASGQVPSKPPSGLGLVLFRPPSASGRPSSKPPSASARPPSKPPSASGQAASKPPSVSGRVATPPPSKPPSASGLVPSKPPSASARPPSKPPSASGQAASKPPSPSGRAASPPLNQPPSPSGQKARSSAATPSLSGRASLPPANVLRASPTLADSAQPRSPRRRHVPPPLQLAPASPRGSNSGGRSRTKSPPPCSAWSMSSMSDFGPIDFTPVNPNVSPLPDLCLVSPASSFSAIRSSRSAPAALPVHRPAVPGVPRSPSKPKSPSQGSPKILTLKNLLSSSPRSPKTSPKTSPKPKSPSQGSQKPLSLKNLLGSPSAKSPKAAGTKSPTVKASSPGPMAFVLVR